MTENLIPELQPLFCSRASLLQAQDKLTNNPELDCQMRLRFADGSEVALNIKRADIEDIICDRIGSTEDNINNALDKYMQSSRSSIINDIVHCFKDLQPR